MKHVVLLNKEVVYNGNFYECVEYILTNKLDDAVVTAKHNLK